MGLGTFLSGFHHPAPGNGDASGWSSGRSSCVGCTGSFRGGSTRLWKLVILGGCFACLKTVRAIHSHGGKKMRIDEDRDEDGSVASHDVELRTGRILALRTPRVIKKAAGAKRGWTAGDVSSSPISEFPHRLRKLTSSLRGGGNDVAGPNRLPRHEGGKDSSRYSESGSGSLTRFRRGEIRPVFGASRVWVILIFLGINSSGSSSVKSSKMRCEKIAVRSFLGCLRLDPFSSDANILQFQRTRSSR